MIALKTITFHKLRLQFSNSSPSFPIPAFPFSDPSPIVFRFRAFQFSDPKTSFVNQFQRNVACENRICQTQICKRRHLHHTRCKNAICKNPLCCKHKQKLEMSQADVCYTKSANPKYANAQFSKTAHAKMGVKRNKLCSLHTYAEISTCVLLTKEI